MENKNYISILITLFFLFNPIIYYLLIRKRQADFSFWFIFYSTFKITPYIFPFAGTWFELFFSLKIYFNLLFLLYLIWQLVNFIRQFHLSINSQNSKFIDEYTYFSEYLQTNIKYKKFGQMISFEICSFYYALFKWRNNPESSKEFTGYKNSGVLSIYIGLMFVSVIEALGFHAILISRHKIIALVLLILHLYLLINLTGQIKAIIFRKHIILDQHLYICYGLFNTLKIPISTIIRTSKFESDYNKKDKNLLKIALLGKMEPHNILIELQENIIVHLPFGIVKKPKNILLYIDKHNDFISEISSK